MAGSNRVKVISAFRDTCGRYISATVEWSNGERGFFQGPPMDNGSITGQEITQAIITVDGSGAKVASPRDWRNAEQS